jgi:N-acetylgalactosamine-N,N'-diacetylbacillosaminyl-diphospho-undecaprenol 4-alpha-N-acetylgalactosaminyltransferase
MKKAVFFINSLAGGGAERVVSTLINNLVNKYDCYIILLENTISYDIDNRIKVIHLNSKLNSGFLKFISLFFLAFKLSKIIKQYQFNMVISFLARANYINILSNTFTKHKVIISERIAPSSMYADNSLTAKINKFLISHLYNKADNIISVSKAIKQDLINNFNISIMQNVIYNPYNLSNIETLSTQKLDKDIQEKSIITVGSLCTRKNHSLLLNSFANISDKDYKLYILGIGEELDNLKNLTQELHIENRVVFLGFDANPYKYLFKCDIFVLTSNSEGFPNVLVEALSCGLPVIATDCLSGPREIIAPNTDYTKQLQDDIELAEYGILTPIYHIEQLTRTINVMISDEELKKNYKDKAKSRANDFNIDEIITQYEQVICAE